MEEEPSSPRRDKGIFHSPLGTLSIPGARRSRLRVMKPSRLPFVISSRHYPRFRSDFRPQIWGSSSFLLFIISIFRLFHLGFQKSAERDHFSRSLSFFFPHLFHPGFQKGKFPKSLAKIWDAGSSAEEESLENSYRVDGRRRCDVPSAVFLDIWHFLSFFLGTNNGTKMNILWFYAGKMGWFVIFIKV